VQRKRAAEDRVAALHWDRGLYGPNVMGLSDFPALATATSKENRLRPAAVERKVFQTQSITGAASLPSPWPSRHGTELPGAEMLHDRHAATDLCRPHPTKDV
jgi:hypothetical protein